MSQVFSWDLKGLSPADRFFHLARAYLDCSGHLFRSLKDKSLKRTFSHAQSAAFLFEHSVEPFTPIWLQSSLCSEKEPKPYTIIQN